MGKTPCCSSGGMKKGFWTPEEDFRLINCIQIHGEGNWRIVPLRAGLARCGKACRLRWMNYLRPDIKRGHISADEEDLILRLHKLVGNRWSLIAGRIPGRTDNEIKNHWNTHLSKRLGTRIRNHKKFRRSPLRIEEVHEEPMQNFKQISDGYYCNIQIPSDSTTMLGAGYDNSLEPMQNFNQKIDGYDARTAINDFSSSFKQISDGYGDHQLSSLPMPFISAGYENIIEDINSGENLVGRESNMQLQSTLLGADCNIQIPSSRVEIDEVDAKKGKCMVVNPSTITAECCEPFSALSDWLNAPNDYIPSVEDYWG